MSQSGSVSSMPPTVTVPAVGSSSRLMHRSRVDLPDPLGPMTQTTWPLRISRSIPRSTSRVPKLLCSPETATSTGAPVLFPPPTVDVIGTALPCAPATGRCSRAAR